MGDTKGGSGASNSDGGNSGDGSGEDVQPTTSSAAGGGRQDNSAWSPKFDSGFPSGNDWEANEGAPPPRQPTPGLESTSGSVGAAAVPATSAEQNIVPGGVAPIAPTKRTMGVGDMQQQPPPPQAPSVVVEQPPSNAAVVKPPSPAREDRPSFEKKN